jgi:hypothetical protein
LTSGRSQAEKSYCAQLCSVAIDLGKLLASSVLQWVDWCHVNHEISYHVLSGLRRSRRNGSCWFIAIGSVSPGWRLTGQVAIDRGFGAAVPMGTTRSLN